MIKHKEVSEQSEATPPSSYLPVLEQLKADIQQTQLRTALAVTKEVAMLYWRIGKVLSEMILKNGWGFKTLERLSRDLIRNFPDARGFSLRNLQYMREYAEGYLDPNYAAIAAQVPWGHNLLLLDKIDSAVERLWYIQQVLEYGWSRETLEKWVESDLYSRSRRGKALTNFQQTLPSPRSEIAQQILKDPYNFAFLTLDTDYREKELEAGLMAHLQTFLVELGDGFAFLGRQFPIKIEGEEHLIDLLFYHAKLHCYVVIELKATAFDPRDAGQMNFYLSAVDDLLKSPEDQPSIGILLCKTKNKVKVEYALRNSRSPIGVASYETKILKSLPEKLKTTLPTVEEIEAELSAVNSLEVKSVKKTKPSKRKKRLKRISKR